MTTTDLRIRYSDKKTRRTTLWLIRQFTNERAFLPMSRELYRERGLAKQYRGDGHRTYFPTEVAWDAFVKFVKLVQRAEPFATRSTTNDTHQAFVQGFANMLSGGLLPETAEDFVEYLPELFKRALTCRAERTFSKMYGITIKTDGFLRIGHCWLGNYGDVCFDAIPETANEHKEKSLQAIADAFENDSVIIAAERSLGTSDRVQRESAYQCELALAILALLINLSYEWAFGKLWQIRRVDRPESGLATHRSFSIIEDGESPSPRGLGLSIKFREHGFDIDEDMVNKWHSLLGLGICNKLVTDPDYGESDLVGRLVNAILHFRLAAGQTTPEMQMSTLWICVESFFTRGSDRILNANLPGLLATTLSSMHRDYWPRGANTPDDLKRTFKKYYRFRSRAVHHGRRGHVARVDVQEFSVVVASLIVDVMYRIRSGIRTPDQLSRASQQVIAQLAHSNPKS